MKSQFITYSEYLDIKKTSFENYDLYHDQEWLNLIKNAFDSHVKPILTQNDKNEIISITPFFYIEKGPFKLIGSPIRGLYTEYMGPLYKKSVTSKEKSIAIRSQHKLLVGCADYIEWGFQNKSNYDEELANFDYLGYSCSSRESLLVDLLGDESDVWGRMSGNARNMIRKSEKLGVTTKLELPDENWINLYYSMLQATFFKQGKKIPHPKLFFLELRSLIKSKKIYFFSSYLGGEVVARAIFLKTNGRMLYLSGTSNEKGLKSASNSSIQWAAIKAALNDGVKKYDMGGLGIKSIDRFKRSFGGKETTTYRWIYKKSLFNIAEPIARYAFNKGWIKL